LARLLARWHASGGLGGSGARGVGLPSVRTRKRLSRLINRLPPTLALWITLAAIILWIVACDKLDSAIASFIFHAQYRARLRAHGC
jgi:hypothetical protein